LPVPTGIQGTGSIGVFSKSHFNGSVQKLTFVFSFATFAIASCTLKFKANTFLNSRFISTYHFYICIKNQV
ncbi:hypothetical protein, partial [Bacillus licheniformis]|uniref:hypothetical protein n=1 Tax=Bacillus licheniformis TaxID=1402 RepID=UPI003F7B6A86